MLTAMILSGGASARFGSDKTQAKLGSSSMIEYVLEGLDPTWTIVVVGPVIEGLLRPVRYAIESPVKGGPVAAIGAGLEKVKTEHVALIAADMPFAAQIIDFLFGLPANEADACIPLDSEGLPQPLCAIYRTPPLRSALTTLGDLRGKSMKTLIQLLQVNFIPLPSNLARILVDVDEPADLDRALELGDLSEKDVTRMDKWISAVQKELGIDVKVDQEAILNLARDAAHTIERKAAPITTFLLGIAVAAGADPKKAAKQIELLAAEWPDESSS